VLSLWFLFFVCRLRRPRRPPTMSLIASRSSSAIQTQSRLSAPVQSALLLRTSVPLRSFSSNRYSSARGNQQPQATRSTASSWSLLGALAGSVAVGLGVALAEDKKGAVDYNAVRKDIAAILDKEDWDDGSLGPVFVRLAWHASGTYDKATNSGGSDGATMRFEPESTDGANKGLQYARAFLQPIKDKYPGISYGDLWTLAGVVAIEEMGGPTIPWRPGRRDVDNKNTVPPNGRLPDAAQAQDHIRNIFYRMGLNDQEIVALAGAHSLGRCHRDRSGFEGPWTRAPTTFSNEYFRLLLEEKWTERKWNGPRQFQDSTGELMMLPADIAFIQDPEFRKWVEKYKSDDNLFRQHFAAAFTKLLELGCKNLASQPFKFAEAS